MSQAPPTSDEVKAIISRCKGQMLSLGWGWPYFLAGAARIEFRVRPLPSGTACIEFQPIERDDWDSPAAVIWVDPSFVGPSKDKGQINDDQLRFVLAHELCHAYLWHHERRGNRDPFLWNVVGDRLINATLLEAGLKACPQGVLFPLDPAHAHLTAEELYEIECREGLGKGQQLQQGQAHGQGQQGQGQDDGGRATSVPFGQGCGPQLAPRKGKGQGQDKDQGQASQGKLQPGEGRDTGGQAQGEKQDQGQDESEGGNSEEWKVQEGAGDPWADARRSWAQSAAQARVLDRDSTQQGRGQGKGVLSRLLDVPPPKVRWEQVLRGACTRAQAGQGQDDVTYQRRNRRTGITGPIFPGPVAHRASVAVVIDTSGSVSDKALSRAIRNTCAIAQAVKARIFLVTHDDGVQWSGWLERGARPSKVQAACKGRGGTTFDAAYRVVEEESRAKFDAMVHLTDGGVGRWPDRPRNARKLVVALIGTPYKSTIPAVAQVIETEVGE